MCGNLRVSMVAITLKVGHNETIVGVTIAFHCLFSFSIRLIDYKSMFLLLVDCLNGWTCIMYEWNLSYSFINTRLSECMDTFHNASTILRANYEQQINMLTGAELWMKCQLNAGD